MTAANDNARKRRVHSGWRGVVLMVSGAGLCMVQMLGANTLLGFAGMLMMLLGHLMIVGYAYKRLD